MLARMGVPVLAFLVAVTAALASYEYRYLEGEACDRGANHSPRAEGFTSWMRHPSGGRTIVFGDPAGGFVEYEFKGLSDGPYSLYIRCLDLPQTRTRALWDGQDLGLIAHDGAPSTSLRWSRALGPVAGPGDHVLRLQGSDDSTQWPYIDAILLTNALGFTPPDDDQDFASYATAWPVLALAGPEGPGVVAPLADGDTAEPAPVVRQVSMGLGVLGPNPVQVTLRNTGPQTQIELAASFGDGAPATAGLSLAPDQEGVLEVQPEAWQSGPSRLRLTLKTGGRRVASGAYPVTVADAATVSLDEYAYPSNLGAGKWLCRPLCAPGLLSQMTVEWELRQLEPEHTVARRVLKGAVEIVHGLPVGRLPVGRYEAHAVIRIGERVVQEDTRPFIRYPATPLPAWEPIKEVKAVGDRLTVNGRPFLARLLYHSGATPEVRAHGCNVVQCWAETQDDPTPQITQHLDACRESGIYGTVALFHSYFRQGLGFSLEHLQQVVAGLKDHPALLAWDLIDEPDGLGVSPEQVAEAATLLRQMDPNHPVWVNLCQYPHATEYLDSQDIWSFDIYPFPTLTAKAYRVWLAISDEALLGRKPLGTCLQTYVYSRHHQRMPTPDELRSSAWLHAIHGYTWFGYYSYYDGEPAGCLARDPELWSHVRALNAELVSCQEAILGSGDWRPLVTDPEAGEVEARMKKVGDKRYVVVVYLGREAMSVSVRPDLAAFKARLLFESDAKPEASTELIANLRPSSVRVFEVTP
jgi:hypothetical protein